MRHWFGITVSIDGDQQEQDRHRTFQRGVGSFEVIAPRIRHLLATNKAQKGRAIGARVTLTAGAAPAPQTFRFLRDELGFDEVGFAPVTAGLGRAYALGELGYERLLREFAELADDYVAAALRDETHGFANLNDILRELAQGYTQGTPVRCRARPARRVDRRRDRPLPSLRQSKDHGLGNVATGLDEAQRTTFLQKAHMTRRPTAGSASPSRCAPVAATTKHTCATATPRTRTCTTASGSAASSPWACAATPAS